ncbi:MAG: DUF3127 domain-containing protein [Rikenellaceae bacterium]
MEFEGTVFQILPAASGTSARGEWQRQEVVFEMQDGSYARKVAVTFFNKPNDVAALKVGAAYVVSFNIESREYQGRYYTNVTAWRVQPKQVEAPAPVEAPAYASAPMPSMPSAEPSFSSSADSEVDDLPF